jgi:hypothetical protein
VIKNIKQKTARNYFRIKLNISTLIKLGNLNLKALNRQKKIKNKPHNYTKKRRAQGMYQSANK